MHVHYTYTVHTDGCARTISIFSSTKHGELEYSTAKKYHIPVTIFGGGCEHREARKVYNIHYVK